MYPYLKSGVILFLLFTCLYLINGCSSSSGIIRYGSDNSKEEEEETSIRYPDNTQENDYPETDTENLGEDDTDESPDDLTSVDISDLEQKISTAGADEELTLREKMLMEIIRYINTPYKYGGNSRDGMDCSGFTQTVYKNCSVELSRSAKEQYKQGIIIENKDELKFGDLVFFDTRKRIKPGHVGIYLGEGLFVHASSRHGVIVTPLSHEYYSKRFMGGRRIEQSVGFQY